MTEVVLEAIRNISGDLGKHLRDDCDAQIVYNCAVAMEQLASLDTGMPPAHLEARVYGIERTYRNFQYVYAQDTDGSDAATPDVFTMTRLSVTNESK